MKRKYGILVILVMMLSISIVVIFNKDVDIKATGGGGGGENNFFSEYYDYLWDNVLKNFSYVVHNDSIWGEGDNVIRKGRAFGTAGDLWTAKYIKEELDKLNLSNVQKIKLSPIKDDDLKKRYYSSRINITDFRLHIDSENYSIDMGFPNDVPLNETFVVPSCRPFGSLTYNFTFEDEDDIRILPIHDDWPKGFSITIYYYNMSCSVVNDYGSIIGNASYIESNETLPAEQVLEVFLIDEEAGCENKLDNVTDATGVILLYNNSTQYTIENTTNYTFPIVRVNSNDSNLSQVLSKIENETVWVENIFCNETLTFIYNLDNISSWPNYNFVCLGRNREPGEKDTDEPTFGGWKKKTWQLWRYSLSHPNKCKGVILYDSYNETHYMNNYNPPIWNGGWIRLERIGAPYLPIFCVNRSVGEWLENHSSEIDNTITGYINQTYFEEDHSGPNETWTAGTEAYNVEGEINIDKSPDDKRVIISNRYDGWWSEAPFDSGVGGGIVLAIAKYFKDYDF